MGTAPHGGGLRRTIAVRSNLSAIFRRWMAFFLTLGGCASSPSVPPHVGWLRQLSIGWKGATLFSYLDVPKGPNARHIRS